MSAPDNGPGAVAPVGHWKSKNPERTTKEQIREWELQYFAGKTTEWLGEKIFDALDALLARAEAAENHAAPSPQPAPGSDAEREQILLSERDESALFEASRNPPAPSAKFLDDLDHLKRPAAPPQESDKGRELAGEEAKREKWLEKLTDEDDYPDMDEMTLDGKWPAVLDLLAVVKKQRDEARAELQTARDALAARPSPADVVTVPREELEVLREIAHIARPRCKKMDESALLDAVRRLDALRSSAQAGEGGEG